MTILAFFALASFLLALIAGTLAAFAAAFPEYLLPLLPFTYLRPFHTLCAFSWIVTGTLYAVHSALRIKPSKLAVILLCGGFSAAALFILSGNMTGREYISWPLPASILMLTGLAAAATRILPHLKTAFEKNRDAAWMIGAGVVLLPLSLAETSLYNLPSIGNAIGKDIAIQWHAVDVMIGSWNLVLFGSALLVKGNPVEKNRNGLWQKALFIVAVSGLLLTFGHHYYPSPQPLLMKKIAFYSSLLAAIAFADHWLRRKEKSGNVNGGTAALLKAASWWALFSIATGFLMALPPVNLYTHGTYFVTAHAMGSMIGVNSMIILALVFERLPVKEKRLNSAVLLPLRVFNSLLCLMVLLLAAAGVARGVWRLSFDFTEYAGALRPIIAFLPLVGLGMTLSIAPLLMEGFKCLLSPSTVRDETMNEEAAGKEALEYN